MYKAKNVEHYENYVTEMMRINSKYYLYLSNTFVSFTLCLFSLRILWQV